MNRLYWLKALFASDPLNVDLANQINNLEWEKYFMQQREEAYKLGFLPVKITVPRIVDFPVSDKDETLTYIKY